MRYCVVSAPPSSALVTAMQPNRGTVNKIRILRLNDKLIKVTHPQSCSAYDIMESGVSVEIPFMISGPIVDSMILSMADPRSDEVEAVESETIMAPSDTALEWTIIRGDSDTSTD